MHGLEQLLAQLVGPDLMGGADPARFQAEARGQRREQRTLAAGHLLECLRGRSGDGGGEDLTEGLVGLAVLLEAAACEHQPPLRRGFGRDLRSEPRGPDARRAGQ